MKKLLQSIFCLSILLTSNVIAQEYTIGVLAKRGVDGFYGRWLMHASYLEKQTGQSFIVKPLNFTEIDKAVAAKTIDFLLTNSSMFVELKKKYQLEAIATMLNKTEQGEKLSQFAGVIFTASSSNINSLADVFGKTFIAVKKNSFGGYQMALKEFQDNKINLAKSAASVEFTNTHDQVVKEVISRPGTIGTVRTQILEAMTLAGAVDMNKVKILEQKKAGDFPYIRSTPLYPEWPMAALATTDKQVVQSVSNALIQMPEIDMAAEMAGIAGWTAALDYSPIDALFDSLELLK